MTEARELVEWEENSMIIPSHAIDLAPPDVALRKLRDGLLLKSTQPLASYPAQLGVHLRRWAAETPARCFIADRVGDGEWRQLTYGIARARADDIAQFLLDAEPRGARRLVIIAPNGIEHAIVALGAMQIGVAVVPLSPSYTRSDEGLRRISYILADVQPQFAFVDNVGSDIIDHLCSAVPGIRILATRVAGHRPNVTDLDDVFGGGRMNEIDEAFAKVDAATVAKILYTSGSTGFPKGVINTHGMLCAQQQMIAQLWRFVDRHPPTLVEWLPWNHTSGGNHSFNMVLRNGGTYYVDHGRPTPAGIEQTLMNLRDVAPTWHTNVPLGYASLLPYLENDHDLANHFFGGLDLLVYGGAALTDEIWQRIDKVSMQVTGRNVRWACGWGLTETASTCTVTHFPVDQAGIIGLPLPGLELKLRPYRDLLSVSARGPNVTPGYLNQSELTQRVFDEEGFFFTGDLVSFVNAKSPERGLRFEGRQSEEFKLATGSWVVPGRIRASLLAATGPIVQDVVIAGPGREYLTAFFWINTEYCTLNLGTKLADFDFTATTDIHTYLSNKLSSYNKVNSNLGANIPRFYLITEPPSSEFGELTEKGSINQMRFLERRAQDIDAVYAPEPTGLTNGNRY